MNTVATDYLIEGSSDTGLVRSENQDRIHIDPQQRFFALADGVGGARGGAVASELAVNSVREHLENLLQSARHRWWGCSDNQVLKHLERAFDEANARVIEESRKQEKLQGMACTLVSGVLHKDHCLCACVGDSRIYLLSNGRIDQISEDQTLASQLVEDGLIEQGDARWQRFSHVLTQAIGGNNEEPPQIQLYQVKLHPGDRLLACSDGLSNMLKDQEINDLVDVERPLAEVIETLVYSANLAGGDDNISAILVAPQAQAASTAQSA